MSSAPRARAPAALQSYEGTTHNPLDLTGCGRDDIQTQVDAIRSTEEATRQAAAPALSDAIDPFFRTVDCADCPS